MPNWKSDYARYRSVFSKTLDFYRKREELIIFLELILTLGTLTVFTVFALKPTIVTIIGLAKEIKAKQETISKMDTKINSLIEAQNTITNQRNNITILESAIPDQPYPGKASAQFIGATNEQQITLNSIYIDELTLKGEYKNKSSDTDTEVLPENAESIDITIDFTSDDFQKLLTLVTNIQNMRRPIKIDTFKLAKKTVEETASPNLYLNITGRLPMFTSISK